MAVEIGCLPKTSKASIFLIFPGPFVLKYIVADCSC